MPDSIEVAAVLPISPERLYQAWLDSQEHGWMTGSPASVDPQVGGRFTAWDGYIFGATLEMQPFTRIAQSWRATDFPEGAPDSRLELVFDPVENGTRLILRHTNLPDGTSATYEQGWLDFYFKPMQTYFENLK